MQNNDIFIILHPIRLIHSTGSPHFVRLHFVHFTLCARFRFPPKRFTLCYFFSISSLCAEFLCHMFEEFLLMLEFFAKWFQNSLLGSIFFNVLEGLEAHQGQFKIQKKQVQKGSECFTLCKFHILQVFTKNLKFTKVRATCNSHLQTTKLIDQRC